MWKVECVRKSNSVRYTYSETSVANINQFRCSQNPLKVGKKRDNESEKKFDYTSFDLFVPNVCVMGCDCWAVQKSKGQQKVVSSKLLDALKEKKQKKTRNNQFLLSCYSWIHGILIKFGWEFQRNVRFLYGLQQLVLETLYARHWGVNKIYSVVLLCPAAN